MQDDTALVLFSGGQDSATCLVWALERFQNVETIALDYGQNHSVELEVRLEFLRILKEQYPIYRDKLGQDHSLDLKVLGQISDTSLTRSKELEYTAAGLPNTFVPARNLVFLSLAAALAYRRDAKHIILGVCETDYSGYPDCRDDTIKAMQVALNLGMDSRLVLHTPLMWRNKAQTWELAMNLGDLKLVELIKEHTHTCYSGNRSTLHEWGYGCNECPACDLRKQGWEKFNKLNPKGDKNGK